MASGINVVDISGAELLARGARRRRKLGGGLHFFFMKDAVLHLLTQGPYLKDIGKENIHTPKSDVIGVIYSKLDPQVCRSCTARIFAQCHVALPNGEPRIAPDVNSGAIAR